MGTAEDSASVVALVPVIAEEGKGVWGLGQTSEFADMQIIADLIAISRVHTEYLFPFIFGVLDVILGYCKTVSKSSYLIKKFAHVFSPSSLSRLKSLSLCPCGSVLLLL